MAGAGVPRRIGIIGGMGPEATVLLMQKIIRGTQVRGDWDHVPMIVDNNPQIPSRIEALIEIRGEDPGPVIERMARRLEDYGAEALAMPCNTAHHYADRIRATVSIPFLDMIHLTVVKVNQEAGSHCRVGMLASPAVRITGIFEKAFGPSGPELMYLDEDRVLLELICHAKTHGGDREARGRIRQIADRLASQGADLLLVSCSELSLISDALPNNICAIDTIDVLAEACIKFSKENSRVSSGEHAA